jgi:nicotinamide mononucleotide transporter
LSGIPEQLSTALAALSVWETAAVALAILYLILVIRQNIWCWAAAIASTTIYIFLMYRAALYMESALQFFYIAIAVYGWRQWRAGGPEHDTLAVSTWPPQRHLTATASILVLAAISGMLLTHFTEAALPYLDSFTTWGAIVTTWMVARKILENWIYWFVIDSVSVYLYISRELYLTSGLFLLYLVLIVIGYRAWRRSMAQVTA